MVTRLLEGDGDPEWKARAVVAGLKAAGWRPTVLAESLDWRTASGSRGRSATGARPSASAREWVLEQSRAAAEQQDADAKARVKARATGRNPDGGDR